MINFFRKIRKQLADDNKPLKYMRYAIGEIVLVVIGILIALSINNWNENQKARVTLNSKLKSLILALESDRHSLIKFEQSLMFKINSLQHLLKLTGIPQVSIEEHFPKRNFILYNKDDRFWKGPYPDTINRKFIEIVIKESGLSRFTGLNSEVYDELKSTGSLSKIENDSLANSLHGYYALFEQEYNDRYFNLINKWRGTLKEQGALFFDIQQIKDPLQLISGSPKISANIKEMIYESAWIEILLRSRLERIDKYIIELQEEIDRTD